MGFTEILTVLFVVLKGLGYLHWSWWLVFSPELIAVAFYVILLIGGIASIRSSIKRGRWLYVSCISHDHN
jgi:hypothetical protein